MSRHWTTMASPTGELTLVATDDALVAISWAGNAQQVGEPAPDHPVLAEAQRQLRSYFAGTRRVFDLPLAPVGTPFQLAVWTALRAVAFGETRSYREIARALGRPTATRAVGAANGRNPLPIVVPCHQVIGADGSLTGFGGGLAAKRWLLDHERRDLFAIGADR